MSEQNMNPLSRMTPNRDPSFITSSPLRVTRTSTSKRTASATLMSPPADAAKKRSRTAQPPSTTTSLITAEAAADDAAGAVPLSDNELDVVPEAAAAAAVASFTSPARGVATRATAAVAVGTAAVSSATVATASATASSASSSGSKRRVVRNLNFAGDDDNDAEPTADDVAVAAAAADDAVDAALTRTPSASAAAAAARAAETPPVPLHPSITLRSHSPHSPSYRQPTLESHGHAPASLLDLFSPPAKAPPLANGEDDVSLSQSHSSLRRSLTRRASSARLGTAETLSESTSIERFTAVAAVVVDADETFDDVISSNDLATIDAAHVRAVPESLESGAPSTQSEAVATGTVAASGSGDAATQPTDGGDGGGGDDEDDEGEFDPYLFIAQLPPLPEELRPRGAVLPARKEGDDRPTLVLDLDETLVHCSIDALDNADFHFPVVFNEVEYKVYVRQRPHFAQFLRDVIAYGFEIVVFTASQRVYADALLHLLDPRGDLIEHRLFRDSCVYVAGNFIKDLSVLGRDMARIAIVDNSPQTFGYQLDNGIPIESWFDDSADTKLLQLLPLLRSLATCPDMRPLLREHFQLSQIVDEKRLLVAGARNSQHSHTQQTQ